VRSLTRCIRHPVQCMMLRFRVLKPHSLCTACDICTCQSISQWILFACRYLNQFISHPPQWCLQEMLLTSWLQQFRSQTGKEKALVRHDIIQDYERESDVIARCRLICRSLSLTLTSLIWRRTWWTTAPSGKAEDIEPGFDSQMDQISWFVPGDPRL